MPILEAKGVWKTFAGQSVLRGVDLTVNSGEIVALMGQNGAGKSTLIKILSGAETADRGEGSLNGKEFHFVSPSSAKHAGICTIYQELSLVPQLSVTENVFLGRLITKRGSVQWDTMDKIVRQIIQTLQIDLNPAKLVSDLSIAEQQLVEIARALAFRYSVIIFDEPTAAITVKEAQRLFSIMRSLKEQGVGMIYISHRLDEISEIADRVSVLRDGQVVFDGPATTSGKILINHMIGHQVERQASVQRSPGKELLKVDRLTSSAQGRTDFQDVSFSLRAGEIVGIAGVVGCGALKVARALYGIHPISSGSIRLDESDFYPKKPERAVTRGIAFISEDRKLESIIQGISIRKNISITILNAITQLGLVKSGIEKDSADAFLDRLKIRPVDPLYQADKLSGGNQQKVALAKWLCRGSKLFIVCEPTRGMDVQAREDVYKILDDLSGQGVGVLVISSDFQEVASVCDRALVMRDGRIVGELPQQSMTEQSLLSLALGAEHAEEIVL
ncbi:MAG: hypothetical protein K0Q73_5355 [Paenibacillus sp.]|nr:hypothetical protein [Paenibacillus sp.]